MRESIRFGRCVFPPPRSAPSRIRESESGGAIRALAPPDVASCAACIAEVFDSASRRFRYPFTTCSVCGPRFSILERLPFDRATTTMRAFALCDACRAEYADPADRRFHAQTIACPACGPRLALLSPEGRRLARDDEALEAAARALGEGRIVAIKGLGGFQLLADAANDDAVALLRARKRRPAKPFALDGCRPRDSGGALRGVACRARAPFFARGADRASQGASLLRPAHRKSPPRSRRGLRRSA
ncbi:MAG: Sua5/YciO/YrdC/YwlC family protein [Burkholderiales bacterium]|nr:Sua5/YciO/YrdC/YwlC family protein [Burkholderiales bacterium]